MTQGMYMVSTTLEISYQLHCLHKLSLQIIRMDSNVHHLLFYKLHSVTMKNLAAKLRFKVQVCKIARKLSEKWFVFIDPPVDVNALVTD